MPLARHLSEYICAAFSGLYIQTFEPDEALREISELCRQQKWRMTVWDLDQGLSAGTGNDASESAALATDPLAVVRALPGLAVAEGASLLVLRNFHRCLGSLEVVQALEHQLALGKHHRTFVVVLAPAVQLPMELERLFVVLTHDLPDREQLRQIAIGLATESNDLPEGAEFEQLLDAACGLTRYEAEGAFSLSLVRHGRLEPSALWELKTQSLCKSGLLSLYRGNETFQDLGGLDSLKAFCLRSLTAQQRQRPGLKPRGVLLLGVPGSGKSAFCKCLGNETRRPTLILDVGALMGSLVGQSEERTRQALRIADAMAPCILMIDEVEKALSGLGTSGQSDSGVTARMFGSLLSWLNDHESDVFVVCTANDVSRLPPEFTRAERFDGLFFLDLPGEQQKRSIWTQYLAKFGLDPDQRLPDDTRWTGAEIKACCRLSALLDVPLVRAALQVVPVAVTAAESVERLHAWAHQRCLSADHAGLYKCSGTMSNRRRIQRDASAN